MKQIFGFKNVNDTQSSLKRHFSPVSWWQGPEFVIVQRALPLDALIFASRIERHSLVICPSGSLLTGLSSLISDFPKNISVPTYPKSHLELLASHPTGGAYHDRHERWDGMRWTRQRQARNVMQGGLAKGL